MAKRRITECVTPGCGKTPYSERAQYCEECAAARKSKSIKYRNTLVNSRMRAVREAGTQVSASRLMKMPPEKLEGFIDSILNGRRGDGRYTSPRGGPEWVRSIGWDWAQEKVRQWADEDMIQDFSVGDRAVLRRLLANVFIAGMNAGPATDAKIRAARKLGSVPTIGLDFSVKMC